MTLEIDTDVDILNEECEESTPFAPTGREIEDYNRVVIGKAFKKKFGAETIGKLKEHLLNNALFLLQITRHKEPLCGSKGAQLLLGLLTAFEDYGNDWQIERIPDEKMGISVAGSIWMWSVDEITEFAEGAMQYYFLKYHTCIEDNRELYRDKLLTFGYLIEMINDITKTQTMGS